MSTSEQLYYIIEYYLEEKINTIQFCDIIYMMLYPEFPKTELSQYEFEEFRRLGKQVARFSEFEEDHINCPNAYNTTEDIKQIAQEVYSNLKNIL